MTTKNDLQNTIDTLKKELAEKDKEVRNTNINFNKLMTANNDLLAQIKETNTALNSNQFQTNPYLNLNLEGQPYLDENMINTNMSIMVKQRLAGLYSTLTGGTSANGTGSVAMNV